MSYPLRRYPLDPTGQSPNNFVQDEEHLLGAKAGPYHPIAPFYGPFYNNPLTLRVVKNNSQLLVPEIDFWCTNVISDATARFSDEVAELIIVKNCEEGDTISISYQNVGGELQNHSQGLLNLYQAWLKDERPIDWVTGIKNKDSEYPPAYHLHMLSDVVGWEGVIVAIERLINVLSLRNVPAFEALIDWVIAKTLEVVSEEEILNVDPVGKAVTFQRLLLAAKKLNFNAIRIEPRQLYRKKGESFVLDIKTTNFDNGETLYWGIDHETSFPHMFNTVKGSFQINGNEATIVFFTKENLTGSDYYQFKVTIRRNSENGPIIATSKLLTLELTTGEFLDLGLLQNGLYTLPSTAETGSVMKTPESMFLIPDDYFYGVSNV